jgi:hypothetical protein
MVHRCSIPLVCSSPSATAQAFAAFLAYVHSVSRGPLQSLCRLYRPTVCLSSFLTLDVLGRGVVLVAHNGIRFDYPLLLAELERHGLSAKDTMVKLPPADRHLPTAASKPSPPGRIPLHRHAPGLPAGLHPPALSHARRGV